MIDNKQHPEECRYCACGDMTVEQVIFPITRPRNIRHHQVAPGEWVECEYNPERVPPLAPPKFTVRVLLDLELGANDAYHAEELVHRHLKVIPGECQTVKNRDVHVKKADTGANLWEFLQQRYGYEKAVGFVCTLRDLVIQVDEHRGVIVANHIRCARYEEAIKEALNA